MRRADDTFDLAREDAAADAWASAARAACAAEPSAATLARIHERAARELAARRRRAVLARFRMYLIPAAAAALVCAATLLAIRPSPAPAVPRPHALLDGMLLLATAVHADEAADENPRDGTDTERLARRLLALQGFTDADPDPTPADFHL